MTENKSQTFSAYLGPEFQKKLIWQLLVEPEFAEKYIGKLSIDYFDDPNIKRFFLIMLEYFDENQKVCNLYNNSIEQAIFKYKSQNNIIEEKILKAILEEIKKWDENILKKDSLSFYDGDVVRKETIKFIKQQEYKNLSEFITAKIKKGIYGTFHNEVEDRFHKISQLEDDELNCVSVVDNIDDVLRKEFRKTIPTSILVIDEVTGGGLGKGEVGIVLAPLGVGKTTTLTKIANAGFNEGKKVLQVIFEDTVEQVQRKHFAIWSKVGLSDIDGDQIIKNKVKRICLKKYDDNIKLGGKLDIVKFSDENTTLNDLRNWIKTQKKKFGYDYDMIVLDYLDCLEPNRRISDPLESELSIIKSFNAMAADYDIPCWTAIQSNRTGIGAETVNANNAGGSIKRLQKAHFVMSIAKPEEMRDADLANLKIVKARFAKDGMEFKECIFSNNTLEIRATDLSPLNFMKKPKIDKDKIENEVESVFDLSNLDEENSETNVFEFENKIVDDSEFEDKNNLIDKLKNRR